MAFCRSWVEISTRQIAENFDAVRRVVGAGVEIMPVVKADAYHHGAVETSRTLVAVGARWLAVSNVEEGVELRDAGLQARILVMAGVLSHEWDEVAGRDLTPALQSLEDFAAVEQLALRAGRKLRYHLKVDTGLGRLGTRAGARQILAAAAQAPHAEMEGLMTHLASASDFNATQSAEQFGQFDALARELSEGGLKPRYLHAAATSAIAYGLRAGWRNTVRPGLSLYGYISTPIGDPPERLLEVKPALTWKAAVLEVKEVPAGAAVGYNALFRASRPTRVAVLAAGYADGYPHQLGNCSRVVIQGRHAALLGAVSMDLLTVDATDCPQLKPGDAVTLLGTEGEATVDATELARGAGTIPYTVLCGLAARVRKVYV